MTATDVDRHWGSGRPRVLITDNWPANLGDMAIAIATERLVRSLAPGASVVHSSYLHDAAIPDLATRIVLPSLEDLLGTPWRKPDPAWTETGRQFVASCDLIISQGGGFFYEHYQPIGRIEALRDASGIAPRLAVFGQSIGRFQGAPARASLGAVLANASLVGVRDETSALHVLDLGAAPETVMVGADVALGLFESPPADVRPEGNGVAVVLSGHSLRDAGASEDRVVDVARSIVAQVLSSSNRPVILLSTCLDHGVVGAEDDGPLVRAVAAKLTKRQAARVTVMEGPLKVETVVDVCGSASAVVSMRFHPAVFALAQGVPAALIQAGTKGDSLDIGPLRCRNPLEPVDVAVAIDAALGAIGDRSQETWALLGPARTRLRAMTARLAEVLASCS